MAVIFDTVAFLNNTLTVAEKVYKLIFKKQKHREKAVIKSTDEIRNEVAPLDAEVEASSQFNHGKIQIRLKKLFNAHGIDDEAIVRFVVENIDKNITVPLSQIENVSYVFDQLQLAHIDAISDLFGVNRGWLHGQDRLYPSRRYYKDVSKLIDFILERVKEEPLAGYAIVCAQLDKDDKNRNPSLYLMFRTPIAKLFGRVIYRYYPISTDWHWGYWRTRYQAKAIFLLFDKYSCLPDIQGVIVSNANFDQLSSSEPFPHLIIEDSRNRYWTSYDYVTSSSHDYAKEQDELSIVLNYIEEQGYKDYLQKEWKKISSIHALF